MMQHVITDRRPIHSVFRILGHGLVDWCVHAGVHPDTISYCSVIFAAGAGVLIFLSTASPVLLLVAPVFLLMRLYCNMIDGMVAVKARIASARGEVINELPDRISDSIIFVCVGLSGHAYMPLAFWIAFGMLAVTYIGVLGKAVGARRQFGGIMSKQNRMFVLAAACLAQYVCLPHLSGVSFSVIDLTNVLILVGLVQTAFVRTRGIFRGLP